METILNDLRRLCYLCFICIDVYFKVLTQVFRPKEILTNAFGFEYRYV